MTKKLKNKKAKVRVAKKYYIKNHVESSDCLLEILGLIHPDDDYSTSLKLNSNN